jgi:hypothetical protein
MTDPRPTTWSAALSRRKALVAVGGLTAAMAGTRLAVAQEATPAPAADDAERIFTMFVQTAHGGHFVPKPGEDGVYQLVLRGASAHTVHFSDRPQRIVGSVSTADFLGTLGFSEENPPNAAVVAQTEGGGEDVIVVALLNPDYDSGSQTLTYDVVVLDEYVGDGFGELAQQTDPELPETFGHTSLFIDDCPDLTVCVNDVDSANNFQQWSGPVPGGPYKQGWTGLKCMPLDENGKFFYRQYLDLSCTDTYPDHCPNMSLWLACSVR